MQTVRRRWPEIGLISRGFCRKKLRGQQPPRLAFQADINYSCQGVVSHGSKVVDELRRLHEIPAAVSGFPVSAADSWRQIRQGGPRLPRRSGSDK